MWPRFDSWTQHHMCVEFVVGSRLCLEVFLQVLWFSPLTNISKFQFDLGYCEALYHEPLVREIVQAVFAMLLK